MSTKCPQCGADFDDNMPSCPYCGAFHYKGAEAEYMGKLEGIKDDLGKLSNVGKHTYKKEIKHHIRRLVLTVSVIAGVILLVVMFIRMGRQREEAGYQKRQKEQLLWQRETFPQLDKWYEEGNLNAILEFQNELYESENGYSIVNWEHILLIEAYGYYRACYSMKEHLEQQSSYERFELEDAIYGGMQLVFNEDMQSNAPEEDREQMLQYRKDARQILLQNMKFTENEMIQLYEDASQEGWIDMKMCWEYADIVEARITGQKEAL